MAGPMANEDPDYLDWIRRQPCAACGRAAPSEPHHPRHNVAMGRRAHDHRAVPLCGLTCHVPGIHALAGRFAGWTNTRVAAWCDDVAARLFPRYVAIQESTFPM